MKKLTLTKETIRDLSKPELDQVAGGRTRTGGVCQHTVTDLCNTPYSDCCQA